MKKILLIEDNDDIRENTAEILELANYKVVDRVGYYDAGFGWVWRIAYTAQKRNR